MDALVPGRPPEPRVQLPRPLGRAHPRRDRRRLGGRGRRGPASLVRGAPQADRPAREHAPFTRRGGTRRGRHLHADGTGNRRCVLRVREAGRDLAADLLRLRRSRRRHEAQRRGREGPDHGGRVPSAREERRYAERRRGGHILRSDRSAHSSLAQTRQRNRLGRAPLRAARPLRNDLIRRRVSAVHRLHERHDRPPERSRPRPRRLPREDRRGGRLPGRREAR